MRDFMALPIVPPERENEHYQRPVCKLQEFVSPFHASQRLELDSRF
jgi:hypothetical protein